MSSFAKMLKDRPKNILFYSFFDDSNMVADLSKQGIKPDDVILMKDQIEWEWKNGGKEFAKLFVDGYNDSVKDGSIEPNLSIIDLIIGEAIWVLSLKICMPAEIVLGADRYKRTYDLAVAKLGKKKGEAWIEKKAKELEK